MNMHALQLPLDPAQCRGLKTGAWVSLSGCLYTARDAALKKICQLLEDGKNPPMELKGQTIYFVGPTPAAPGETFGAAGPTTSRRMEPYLPLLLAAGVMAVIGKGPLSAGLVEEFQRHGALYLAAVGGAGALYGSCVRGATVLAYEDLGPEAVYGLNVEKFPAVVAINYAGKSLFELGPAAHRKDS